MENKRVIGLEPAYPVLLKTGDGRGGWSYETCGGETIRQHACIAIAAGMAANQDILDMRNSDQEVWIAEHAIELADAVLAREEATRNG